MREKLERKLKNIIRGNRAMGDKPTKGKRNG